MIGPKLRHMNVTLFFAACGVLLMIIVFHPTDVLRFHSSREARGRHSETVSSDENVDIVVEVSEELFRNLQGGDQKEIPVAREKLRVELLKLRMKRLQRNKMLVKTVSNEESEKKFENLASEQSKVFTPMPNYGQQLLRTAFGDALQSKKEDILITHRMKISTSKQVHKARKEVTATDANKLSMQTTKRTLSPTKPAMKHTTSPLQSKESKLLSTRPEIRYKKPTLLSTTSDLQPEQPEPRKSNISRDVTKFETSEPKAACIIPKLNPFDKTAMKYINDVGTHVCNGVDHAVVKDGVLKVKASNARDALIRYIRRKKNDDFQLEFSEPIKLVKNEKDPMKIKSGLTGCLVAFDGNIIGTKKTEEEKKVSPVEWTRDKICVPENYFRFMRDGTIKDFSEGHCIRPVATVGDGIRIEFTDECGDDWTEFTFESTGKLKHKKTGKCLAQRDEGGEVKKTILELIKDCNISSRTSWQIKEYPPNKEVDANVTVTEDFIELVIATDDSIIREHYAEVRQNKQALKRSKDGEHKPGLPYNVAFLMFDSQSAANVERKMPKTFKYLSANKNNVFLKGHTINGDGTTAQLCAALVGASEENLPEARRGREGSQSVDRWPFVFRNFTEKGYVSLFSEDDSTYGAFQYRLNGFGKQPTDHYPRPFWSRMPFSFNSDYCVGARKAYDINLNYTMTFFDAYAHSLKFSLTVFSQLFHNTLNEVRLADDSVLSHIDTLKKKGHLDKTILITFGDHGLRAAGFRSTIQGKLEERLPFMSILLPPSLVKEHPQIFEALQHNSKVLTSHFDTHATLQHLLNYPTAPKVDIGQSLFTKIDPVTRTCKSVGIKDHWCPCLKFSEVDNNSSTVIKAAKAIVQHINEEILSAIPEAKGKCSKLRLSSITRAGLKAPSDAVQTFVSTSGNDKCDECGVVTGKKPEQGKLEYELVFSVEPSKALFEAKVAKHEAGWIVDSDISRINLYGNQPKCIQDKYPNLRKYCFCK